MLSGGTESISGKGWHFAPLALPPIPKNMFKNKTKKNWQTNLSYITIHMLKINKSDTINLLISIRFTLVHWPDVACLFFLPASGVRLWWSGVMIKWSHYATFTRIKNLRHILLSRLSQNTIETTYLSPKDITSHTVCIFPPKRKTNLSNISTLHT